MSARHFSFSILPRKKHRNATRPSQLKEHSTQKSLCRGTKTAPIWLDTCKVRARECSFCRVRQNGIDFARQSNKHCLARQLCAIDIRLKRYWAYIGVDIIQICGLINLPLDRDQLRVCANTVNSKEFLDEVSDSWFLEKQCIPRS
jgi:hypothetical protein